MRGILHVGLAIAALGVGSESFAEDAQISPAEAAPPDASGPDAEHEAGTITVWVVDANGPRAGASVKVAVRRTGGRGRELSLTTGPAGFVRLRGVPTVGVLDITVGADRAPAVSVPPDRVAGWIVVLHATPIEGPTTAGGPVPPIAPPSPPPVVRASPAPSRSEANACVSQAECAVRYEVGWDCVAGECRWTGASGEATLRYEEGRGVPPGYHVEERPRRGLVIGGAAVLGGFYLLTLETWLGAAGGGDSDPAMGWLVVPLAGPIITMATYERCSGGLCFDAILDVYLGVLAAGQVIGAILLLAGLEASPKTVLVRDAAPTADRGRRWAILPRTFGTGAGLALFVSSN